MHGLLFLNLSKSRYYFISYFGFVRLGHTLKFEDPAPVLARDANTKGDDWFDIYDPRNPLNKRKREESKKTMKERGSSSKKNDL